MPEIPSSDHRAPEPGSMDYSIPGRQITTSKAKIIVPIAVVILVVVGVIVGLSGHKKKKADTPAAATASATTLPSTKETPLTCADPRQKVSSDPPSPDLGVALSFALGTGHTAASIAASHTALWVADAGGHDVIRVGSAAADPITSVAMKGQPKTITVSGADVWVSTTGPDAVVHIDANTRQVVGVTTFDDPVASVFADGSGLWATTTGTKKNLVHVDRKTAAETDDSLAKPSRVIDRRGADVVVAAIGSGVVSTFAPTTHATKPIAGASKLFFSSQTIARTKDTIWITTADGTTLQSVDPRTFAVKDSISLPIDAHQLASGAGAVWVLSAKGNQVARVLAGHTKVQLFASGGIARTFTVTDDCMFLSSISHPESLSARPIN